MDLRTYRATTIQEALQLVRRDLGPDASVLHTREIKPGLLGLWGSPEVEVVASREVDVPSRLPQVPISAQAVAAQNTIAQNTADEDDLQFTEDDPLVATKVQENVVPPAHEIDFRLQFRNDLEKQFDELHSSLEDLCHQVGRQLQDPNWLDESQVVQLLVDRQFSPEVARELVRRLIETSHTTEWSSETQVLRALEQTLLPEMPGTNTISSDKRDQRIVALVGPTGVGKTTTIAKLAAYFHLQEHKQVGLITVDTYRIAAVEQLRTYAEIIDLPMEVVSSPKEMRRAITQLSKCELILMDTAGRSPRDELKIQELRMHLAEAQANEVHLVLSCVASESSIVQSAARFADLGATSMILTKLDEALGLGNLIPLFRSSRLPLSYLTFGQDVPDDLEPADRQRLVRRLLRLDDELP